MSIQISEPNLTTLYQDIKKYSPHPSQVNIIAVTKGFNYQAIISAISHNINCIGENRIQEFSHKQTKLQTKAFESHLIGHLQSNKIKKAIELFNVIQTVDSIKLAETINKRANKNTQRIYIQINIGNDPNKFGFKVPGIYKKIEKIEKFKNLKIEGLMTILPYLNNLEESEKLFAQTRKIFKTTKNKISQTCKQLSMGMSRDYIYALKQGATHIRIGTLLYGPR